MEIFYINIKEFINKYGTGLFAHKAGCDKYKIEHSIGRFLVKSTAEKIYGINDTEIVLNNKKPEFKDKKIEFSITHSKDYVMAAFDQNPCGLDLEFMADKDLNKFAARYGKKFDTKEDFYKFWTQKEAVIKLQSTPKYIFTQVFKDCYTLSAASSCEFLKPVCRDFLEII
ncbi:hypothetical protein IJ579_04900 [bacterium]|nr:hypothetical protein [bacterium]